MSKITLFAASVAGLTWATTALEYQFRPPEIVDVNRFEISQNGFMVMDRTVNKHAASGGEQALLSITIEGADDRHVCSGQRLINLRPDEARIKRWFVNDWFEVKCELPIEPGAIAHATWVPVDRDAWSITSARWVVPQPLPPL